MNAIIGRLITGLALIGITIALFAFIASTIGMVVDGIENVKTYGAKSQMPVPPKKVLKEHIEWINKQMDKCDDKGRIFNNAEKFWNDERDCVSI